MYQLQPPTDLGARLPSVLRRFPKNDAFAKATMAEVFGENNLAAAEARATALRIVFGDRVGLVHGRLAAAEKDAVMADFAEGRLSVLVATTVVEVGVDVPSATIMVIEQAERFGLAQLHQLRGRVGRGLRAAGEAARGTLRRQRRRLHRQNQRLSTARG